MKSSYTFTLIVETTGRADQLLLKELKKSFPEITRNRLKPWFQDRRIYSKHQVLQASSHLSLGEYLIELEGITTEALVPPQAQPCPRGCFLPILYEDETLLILNKTSGTASVPHLSSETDTAVNAALAHDPSLKSIGNLDEKLGLEPAILHRLDTGTSGILAFAKSQEEYLRLRPLWGSGRIRKTYRALVTPSHLETRLPQLPHEIRISLAHDLHSTKRMIALSSDKKRGYRGQPLPTLTRILSATALKPDLWDLEIAIETGVMHQIRCTLSHIGFPILGDTLYRGLPSARLWLHAWRLEIPRPEPEKPEKMLFIEAPLPEFWGQTQSIPIVAT